MVCELTISKDTVFYIFIFSKVYNCFGKSHAFDELFSPAIVLMAEASLYIFFKLDGLALCIGVLKENRIIIVYLSLSQRQLSLHFRFCIKQVSKAF
jgi:hypothetical protein